MAFVEQDFAVAPAGKRVILVSFGTLLSMLGAEAAVFIPARRPAPAREWMFQIGVLVFTTLVLSAAFLYRRNRVSVLRLKDDTLRIGRKSYPIAGLLDAARDPLVLSGARKRCGNDGLGAVTGNFKSKRIGKFEAVLTDADKAVVLRWPEKVLAVSPADPEFFVLMVRKAAGLS